MHTNVEYLSCGEIETFGYFQLLDMRYDGRNMVTKRVSTTTATLLNLNNSSNFRTGYRIAGESKTPATTKMEFFVTLVDG